MIITIDGPSGTGKSTVAKSVAEKLHFSYFDTGAMYRAISWFILQKGTSLADQEAIEEVLSHFSFEMREEEGIRRYFVMGQDVTEAIRKKEVTDFVSAVSALPQVRRAFLSTQREYAASRNVVFEGRDLGSVVFPNAEVKIFLTARPDVRAHRRYEEIMRKDPTQPFSKESILLSIQKRDEYDSSRELAPLKCPEGAFVIDTSDVSISEVVSAIIKYAKNKENV